MTEHLAESALPIYIDCEGSGCPPCAANICSMCGEPGLREMGGVMAPHRRRDILAEIERGDFDAR